MRVIEKTSIYLKGVKKRNKTDEAEEYETRLRKYQALLEQLEDSISAAPLAKDSGHSRRDAPSHER